MLYRIAFAIDVIAAAVVLFFFMWGISDGTVSSFNIGIWLVLLIGVGGILAGGWGLKAKGQNGAAIAVLAILAIPAFLAGVFVLLLIVFQPRWN